MSRYNVIAQTKGGDPDNVLVMTAHTDSVDPVRLSNFLPFLDCLYALVGELVWRLMDA